MIKLQFKLPQTLISQGFTRRTVLHAPAFQQKGSIDLWTFIRYGSLNCRLGIRCGPLSKHPLLPARHLPHLTIASIRPSFPGINPYQEMRQNIENTKGKAVVVTKGTGATSVVYFYYLYILCRVILSF